MNDEAVEAAAEAIRYNDPTDRVYRAESPADMVEDGWHKAWLELARECLAAALPHIRQQIEREIIALAPYNCELRPDGSEDPQTAAWVEGIKDAARVARGVS